MRAVRGVDLTLGRQSVLGIVGESGCGKSITAMSVMQLIKSPPGRIVEGEILFHRKEGKPPINIVDLDPASAARCARIRGGEIAVIFQEPMTSLNPLFSVGRQITEVIKLHQNVSDAQAEQRALEMLEAGADQRAQTPPQTISAPVVRRYAPACDDCDGALVQPGHLDRRRADHGARRDGAGADLWS